MKQDVMGLKQISIKCETCGTKNFVPVSELRDKQKKMGKCQKCGESLVYPAFWSIKVK